MNTEPGDTRPLRGQPYPLGVTVAGYTLVDWQPAKVHQFSVYRVIAACCGQEREVAHRTLKAREHGGTTLCPDCARAQNLTKVRQKERWTIGERFGLAEIIAPLTRDLARVRWTCCGREEELTHQALVSKRHMHRRRPWRVCPACTEAKRLNPRYDPTRQRAHEGVVLPGHVLAWYRLPVPAGLTRDVWGRPCLS